jgi:hypothetical protein
VHEKLVDGPTSAKKVEGDCSKEDALHESDSNADPCLKDEPLHLGSQRFGGNAIKLPKIGHVDYRAEHGQEDAS